MRFKITELHVGLISRPVVPGAGLNPALSRIVMGPAADQPVPALTSVRVALLYAAQPEGSRNSPSIRKGGDKPRPYGSQGLPTRPVKAVGEGFIPSLLTSVWCCGRGFRFGASSARVAFGHAKRASFKTSFMA